MGEDPNILDELKLAVNMKAPLVVVAGSKFSDAIIEWKKTKAAIDGDLAKLLKGSKIFILENGISEDLAAFVHFLLTVTV